MDTATLPVPGPVARIACPWCDEPLPIDPATEELDCPACLVRVAVDPSPSPREAAPREDRRAA